TRARAALVDLGRTKKKRRGGLGGDKPRRDACFGHAGAVPVRIGRRNGLLPPYGRAETNAHADNLERRRRPIGGLFSPRGGRASRTRLDSTTHLPARAPQCRAGPTARRCMTVQV